MTSTAKAIALGLGGIAATAALKAAVWFHFLDTTQNPSVVNAFDEGSATFGMEDYVRALGTAELFPRTDPHTWIIGILCLVIIALLVWLVGTVFVRVTRPSDS